MNRSRPLALAFLLLIAGDLAAQGTLSTQGLGFPTGQLSTGARMMGGATGEADALSPLNPAALSMLSTPVVSFQSAPEFRRVRVGSVEERTSVSRFPLFLGALPLGSRYTVALSSSTLLDRTWATSSRDTQFVGTDTMASTLSRRSVGSIADTRLAMSFATSPWLRFGAGLHFFSGSTDLRAVRAFDDTVLFAPDTLRSTVGFGGTAISLGAQAFFPRIAVVGVTYRRGGELRTYEGDDVVDEAAAPDHMGVSVVYLGISGTQLAVRIAKDSWSRMRDLGTALEIHEGLDIGIGADVRGPVFGGTAISMRAGGRWRTLPFSSTGNPVRERSVSGGFGLPMAGNRVELNVGGVYSARTTSGDASERAWTILTGFLVRP